LRAELLPILEAETVWQRLERSRLPRVFGAGIFAVQAAWRGDEDPRWGEEKHGHKR
jgi:hypothetical protein